MVHDILQRAVALEDKSMVPSVVGYIAAVLFTFGVLAKFATKLSLKIPLGVDDVSIVLAAVLAHGTAASFRVAAEYGLGKHIFILSDTQVTRFEKSVYASEILYVAALFASKISMLQVFEALTPVKTRVALKWAASGFIGVWAMIGIFVAAFQCPTPDTWALLNPKCINQRGFWLYFGTFNIITELSIVAITYLAIRDIQVPGMKQTTVTIVFSLRLLTIIPMFAELHFVQNTHQAGNDLTFAMYPVAVCRNIILALSVITACLPFVQPLFLALGNVPVSRKTSHNDIESPPAYRSIYIHHGNDRSTDQESNYQTVSTEYDPHPVVGRDDEYSVSGKDKQYAVNVKDRSDSDLPKQKQHPKSSSPIARTDGFEIYSDQGHSKYQNYAGDK